MRPAEIGAGQLARGDLLGAAPPKPPPAHASAEPLGEERADRRAARSQPASARAPLGDRAPLVEVPAANQLLGAAPAEIRRLGRAGAARGGEVVGGRLGAPADVGERVAEADQHLAPLLLRPVPQRQRVACSWRWPDRRPAPPPPAAPPPRSGRRPYRGARPRASGRPARSELLASSKPRPASRADRAPPRWRSTGAPPGGCDRARSRPARRRAR